MFRRPHGCARPVNARACSRSNRRLTSLQSPAGSIRSSYGFANEPKLDPDTGFPFSSRGLVQCLEEGAERFGWNPCPAISERRRQGRWLVGRGVAAFTYPARTRPSAARARAEADGTYTISLAASDVGTGARTALGLDRRRRARRVERPCHSRARRLEPSTGSCSPAARWEPRRGEQRSSRRAGRFSIIPVRGSRS